MQKHSRSVVAGIADRMVEEKDRYILPLIMLILADLAVFSLSFMGSYYFRFYTVIFSWYPPPMPPYIPDPYPYFILSLVIGLIGVGVFERFGLYERRVGMDRQVRSSALILAILVTYIFIMAILFNYRGISYSRLTVALAIPFSSMGIIYAHLLLKRTQFLMIRKGIIFQKTLLVGPQSICEEINHKLQFHHGSQFQILGYVNTEQKQYQSHSPMPCLGRVGQLPALLKKNLIDNVIIAMPSDNYHAIVNVLRVCARQNISYHLIPELFDLLCRRLRVEEIVELPTIVFGETPLYGTGRLAKRTMDIIIAGAALIISSPLLFLIPILIKLDSRGSVFYVQERVSNDGRRFNMFKFRSMIDQAEFNTGPKWASSNDPRTTRIGRFIRRYNLDELPQFINVLLGDMSVVGPRPERPYFINKFKEEIPNYMRRHIVKSGLTGWAQVNGMRGDTSVMERTKYDLYYVENWSILFDLQILWKTLTSFKNAY